MASRCIYLFRSKNQKIKDATNLGHRSCRSDVLAPERVLCSDQASAANPQQVQKCFPAHPDT